MKRIFYQHKELVKRIKFNQLASLLDIGCGRGEKSIFFASLLNMKVVAIDNFMGSGSHSTYEDAKRNIIENRLSHLIRLKSMDAKKLSFTTEKFDVAFAQNSLHHIFPYPFSCSHSATEFFVRIKKHLSENGFLYICDVGRVNVWDKCLRMINMKKTNNLPIFNTIKGVHFDDKTPVQVWLNKLTEAGFFIESIKYHVPYPFRRLNSIFNNRIGNVFLESNYMITARKTCNRKGND